MSNLREDATWIYETAQRTLKTRFGWSTFDYVIDCRETTGHIGRYPRPLAEFVSEVAREFTGRDYGTISARMYRDEVAYHAAAH